MARFWPKDPSTMVGSISIQLAPARSIDSDGPTTTDTSSVKILHYANIEKVTAKVKKILRQGVGGLEELTVQVTA